MMQVPPPSARYCLFSELGNNIWEFRFVKATNEAVDEWVAWQNYLKNLPPEPGVTMVRTLLDFRPEGPIPMLYALQKNFEWRRQNPDVDPIPVKVAIMLKPMNGFQKGYTDLLKEGVNVFGMRKVRIELFTDTYQSAVDWLLEP
jgi:hypothetical protein